MDDAIRLIFILLWAVIWGLAADKIIKNKGYDNNWFWWGFFFGWIAVLIAITKPDNRSNYTPQYDKNSSLSVASEQKRREEQIKSGYWQCSCGLLNPPYCTTCVCGKTPKDVIAEKKAAKTSQTEEKELENIKLLKEYKKLLDSGTITEEEFEQKKTKILNN